MSEHSTMSREEKLRALGNMADAELRETRALIDEMLRRNDAARKRKAVADIRRIAKENGLNVSVSKRSKKRGRPRKTGPAPAMEKESA